METNDLVVLRVDEKKRKMSLQSLKKKKEKVSIWRNA